MRNHFFILVTICFKRNRFMYLIYMLTLIIDKKISEPHRDKTGFLPMRKQRRRSASR